MNRYEPLGKYLEESGRKIGTLSFQEINSIISPAELPTSAYQRPQWCGNEYISPRRQCTSWLNAGYRTVDVIQNLVKQQMTFVRVNDGNKGRSKEN